ncbi:Ldh family oxidoreductase [Streptomyces sp. NBC_00063]|uniref:Ldh family oxidoreductase n=1 Tax=Streptomyces sp. NBC_00063 TaxID=2975638 RepID=UPI003D75ED89
MSSSIRMSEQEVSGLCVRALRAIGAAQQAARYLTRSVLDAERAGNRAVGLAHLFDYLDAYRDGRIVAGVIPEVTRPAPSCMLADARGGLAQEAFEAAADELFTATRENGMAALWIRGAYTCGELGHYPRRAAERGFTAVACANSPALMSLGGSGGPVLGTNPLAYAVPRPGGPPIVIDQASSQTAYVNVREKAAAGEPIPEGWAVGPDGGPTTDASAALAGALLPFGGHRGGNVALLAELLATLGGGSFSLDAAPFDHGNDPPGIGVFLLCLDTGALTGEQGRAAAHLERLRAEHGVRLPALERSAVAAELEVDTELIRRLRAVAGGGDAWRLQASSAADSARGGLSATRSASA